jgi:polyhydroxyalkanoate synthesis regulator phasin
MMKKIAFICVLATMLMALGGPMPGGAAEVDVLINKLVEKGVLSQQDARQLLNEMQGESARQKQAVKEVATQAAQEAAKTTVKKEADTWAKVPKWVERINFKGDFRLRYQYQNQQQSDGSKTTRNRGRYRWRFGAVADVTKDKKWQVGFGLASGSGDPRSTNQTFTNDFETPDARIDYAYAQWHPIKQLKAIGGQMKNPIYFASKQDLTWDSDIRPQGLAVPLKFDFAKNGYVFINPAWFILSEFKSKEETATMAVVQAGVGWDVTEHFWFKFAPGAFINNDVKGNHFTYSSGTNTTDANGDLIYNYNSFTLDGEIGWQKLPYYISLVNFFGQFIRSDADDDNVGWLVGFRFGRQLKKLGDWQFRYSYRELARDAWLDFLPDSDFYGGKTNAKGHEVRFNLALHKHVVFAIDYYNTRKMKSTSGNDESENLLQVDLNFKF